MPLSLLVLHCLIGMTAISYPSFGSIFSHEAATSAFSSDDDA